MNKIVFIILFAVLVILALGFPYFQALAVSQFTPTGCPSDMIREAETRVSETYSTPSSRPIRICLDGPVMGVDVQYGVTHFLPFAPTINVIGPKGMNVDVIAHEWIHAETEHRLGFATRNYKLPVWLDEGIAMQADNRPDYSMDALKALIENPNIQTPLLENMSKAKDFFTQGEQGRLHYALAKCVVAEAISASGVTPSNQSIRRLADLHETNPRLYGTAYVACVK